MPVGRGPARIAFAAPLPIGIAAERELAEIVLTERCEVWRVREGLAAGLPEGWRLAGLEDVWLGAPSLSGHGCGRRLRDRARRGRSARSDGRRHQRDLDRGRFAALMRAQALPRERAKGGGVVVYDLRPLLLDLCVAEAGPPVVLRARTRIHPSLGSGRPEEVVAALGGRGRDSDGRRDPSFASACSWARRSRKAPSRSTGRPPDDERIGLARLTIVRAEPYNPLSAPRPCRAHLHVP